VYVLKVPKDILKLTKGGKGVGIASDNQGHEVLTPLDKKIF
jgi:hypothetical protein